MIEPVAKDEFWAVVVECLVKFHNSDRLEAIQKATELRERIESTAISKSSEIFYHSEPFDVACDIKNQELKLSDYRDQYYEILNRHKW